MMKHLRLLFLFLVCSAGILSAQDKITEGKIVFDITYPDAELDQQTMAMLPDESVLFFKDRKSRVEVKMAMGSTCIISDMKEQSSTTLMDMMGNKLAIRMTREDIEQEQKKRPGQHVTVTEETKKIAGYLCTKAMVQPDDGEEGDAYEVWFTREIPPLNTLRANIQLDGFLMEFRTRQNNMTVKMACRSVTAQPVDDSLFVVPDGYKPMTMEDLKKMGGMK